MSLRLQNLTHRFGRHTALEEVSLHVHRGDCYGFIGHNGAGKTTAMRAALGLLRPQRGRIVVDGFDAARYPREARARMGALVEAPGFHGHWSGEKNLVVLGRLAGMARTDARAAAHDLLEKVGLTAAAHRAVRGYSQGMRQRLGVALALLGDPPYVLLDEPTNGLDPEGVAEMRQMVRQLTRDEGVTVMISSHQLHELADLCNRVSVLREGRLVIEDTLTTLLEAGNTRFTLHTDRDSEAEAFLRRLHLAPAPVAGGGLRVDLGAQDPGGIVRGLVEAGFDVRAFAPRPPTLEEVYLRYTSREREAAAPAGAEGALRVSAPAERRAPRRPLARMMRYEVQRWTGQLTVPALLGLPALLGVLAVVRRHAQVVRDAEEVRAGTLASATDVTAFEGVAVALKASLPLAPYILLGLAGQSVAGQVAEGTLRNVLLRPVARWQLMAGKCLSLFGAAVVIYALLAGAALVTSAWAFDFTDVAEILPNGKRFLLVPASEIWPELERALLSPLLPLLAYAAAGLLAGTVARRGATGLALALGLGVLLDLLRAVGRSYDVEGWLPSAYLPSPLGGTSFVDYYHFAAQGVSNVTFAYASTEVWIPLIWTGAAFALAVLVFQRRFVP
ncbi:MAG: ABC transporter ATP-binding protein [Planctomycetota bacterium]|jgi:ABC-2 type transport system ATP-binding protein